MELLILLICVYFLWRIFFAIIRFAFSIVYWFFAAIFQIFNQQPEKENDK